MIEANAHDFDEFAAALREASDKTLTNSVRASLREVGKPLGTKVLHEGAEKMPHHGGLSERVKSLGKVGLATAIAGKQAKVTLLLNNKGVTMRALDAGILRHPVFGNRSVWARQNVAKRAFTGAFEKHKEEASAAALRAAQSTFDEVARKV